MGEAKRRGSVEERVKLAEIKAVEDQKEYRRLKAEAESDLTDEERLSRKKAQKTLTVMTGIAMGGMMSGRNKLY
jgi:hypothetical protein